MSGSIVKFSALLVMVLTCNQAMAWSHAGSFGRSWGGGGSWGRSGEFGSAEGGGGSWSAESNRGGSFSGGDGSWHATGEFGGSASGYRADGYGATVYHPSTYGTSYYHPPTAVYASSGCYYCGYDVNPAAAAAAGVVTGAAVADAAGTNANAYNAGYNAGMTASVPSAMPIGATFVSLPAGCELSIVSGNTYYQCANAWVRPSYGANGVYYTVVPMPN